MEDNTVIHRNEEAEDDSYYAIKAIHWGGGPCAVLCQARICPSTLPTPNARSTCRSLCLLLLLLFAFPHMQNTNGPCPLLAICNVLLLRKDISIHPDQGEVSLRQISQILAEYALQRTPPGASGSNQLDTLLNLIPRLQYGLDVNVRFDNVQGFEFTEEMTAFDATGVTLRHGWLLDPQDEHTHAAINGKSYNQLVERLVEYKSKALEDTMKKDASDLQVPAHEVEGATPNLPSAAEETKETQLGSDILSREESPQPQSEEVPVALTQSDDLLVVTETLLDSKPKVEIGIMDAGPVMAASGTKPEITEGGGEPVGADLKLVEEVTPPHLTEAEAVAEITLEPLENRVDDAASGTKAKIADGGGEPVTDVFRLVEDVTPSHLAVAETAPEDVTPSHPAVAETAPELLPLDGEGDRPSGVDVTCTDTDAPEEEMPAAQEKHAVDDQHWDSSLLQTATGEPDDREGLIIESFLSGTSSQLTYYGLHKLHEDVAEGELCVFFRNNVSPPTRPLPSPRRAV